MQQGCFEESRYHFDTDCRYFFLMEELQMSLWDQWEEIEKKLLDEINNWLRDKEDDAADVPCHPEWAGKGNHPNFPNDKPVEGEGFDHHWYLREYPDVAQDKCYGNRPYGHYCVFGRNEGRRPYPEVDVEKDERVVNSISPQSFFCIKKLTDGRILAGTYSFPGETSMVYQIKDSTPKVKIDCGESVIDIIDDGNKIYYITEHRGDIYSTDMNFGNLKKELHLSGGKYNGAFGAAVVLGKLVFIGGGEIYTAGVGTTEKFGDSRYVKSVFEHGGIAYAPGYDKKTDSGGWYESKDAVHWSWKSPRGAGRCRFIRGESVGDFVYLFGTANYAGGDHHRDSAAVFASKNMEQVTEIKRFAGFDFCSHGAWHQGVLYASLTKEWKSNKTGAELVALTLKSGFWETETLAQFDESGARGVVIDSGQIYVPTMLWQQRGRVYQVPVRKDTKTIIEMGDYRGEHDGIKPVYRWNKPGGEYPDGLTLYWYEGGELKKKSKKIEDTSRSEPHYGKEGVHWNPHSSSDSSEWKGKLVVMLPYEAVAACKQQGLGKGDKKGCWLQWDE